MFCRSKKEKKHKKEKKSRHRRDKDAAPRVSLPGDSAAAAAVTKSSPAAAIHDTDALRPSVITAANVAHDAIDCVSDGDSDYGPTPLLAAVGDVG